MSLPGPPRPHQARFDFRPYWVVPCLLVGVTWLLMGVLLPDLLLKISLVLLVVLLISILLGFRHWFTDSDSIHGLSLESDGIWVARGGAGILYPYQDIHLIHHPKTKSGLKWFRWQGDWPFTVVHFKNGQTLEIPRDLKNHTAFVKNLMQISFPFRYEPYARAVNQDGQVTMGVLVLSEAGLIGRTPALVPWEKIHALYLWQNQLRYRPMEQFGNPVLCQIAELVDMDVLFSLAMSLATRRRRMV